MKNSLPFSRRLLASGRMRAAFAVFSTLIAMTTPGRADDVHTQVSTLGWDGSHYISSYSPSASYAGNHGSATATAGYGSVHVYAHSTNDGSQYGDYSAAGFYDDTMTINNANLTGQSGTATIRYNVSGLFPQNVSYGIANTTWLDDTIPGSSFNGNTVPYSVSVDYGFTFGSPFQIRAGISARSQARDYVNGDITVDLTLSQRGTTVTSNGTPMDFSAGSNTGSAAGKVVSNGSSFAGFFVTDTGLGSHATTLSIIDGGASADRAVNASFVGAGVVSGAGGTVIGDIADLSGLGSTPGAATDMFTLKMSYNEADAIAQYGSESAMRLLWQNPSTGLFENAVNGNFGGTPFFAGDGAYNPLADFTLGYYGVDTADNYVWAVLNHNSLFGSGQQLAAAPEPSRALLLVFGFSGLLLRRRRK